MNSKNDDRNSLRLLKALARTVWATGETRSGEIADVSLVLEQTDSFRSAPFRQPAGNYINSSRDRRSNSSAGMYVAGESPRRLVTRLKMEEKLHRSGHICVLHK